MTMDTPYSPLNFLDQLEIPSLGPFEPPTEKWGKLILCLQCLVVLTAGINEIKNPTPYSKFATKQKNNTPQRQIESRKGMLLLYTPSMVLAAIVCCLQHQQQHNNTTFITGYLLTIHFLKRVLETAFLHKYSGTMDFATCIGISTFYSLTTLLNATTAFPFTSKSVQTFGILVFASGEIGNLYHHYLLRTLRTNNNNTTTASSANKKKRYVPPQGGLFQWVAAPHYLLEIIAFLGMAMTSLSLHSLLIALGMTSYLAGRAKITQKFYQKVFTEFEWPKERKAILPFLF